MGQISSSWSIITLRRETLATYISSVFLLIGTRDSHHPRSEPQNQNRPPAGLSAPRVTARSDSSARSCKARERLTGHAQQPGGPLQGGVLGPPAGSRDPGPGTRAEGGRRQAREPHLREVWSCSARLCARRRQCGWSWAERPLRSRGYKKPRRGGRARWISQEQR